MNPNPSKFLFNEIALELLGNKIYDLDGNCVPDLNTLCIGNTKKSNSKQGSSSKHANEKSLQEILGITDEMLEAPTDAEESEVISLTDDDDEKTNEGEGSSSTNVTTTEPSVPLSVKDSEVISLTDGDDDDDEKTNEDECSSSTTSTVTEPSLNTKIKFTTRRVSQKVDGKELQEILGITDEMLEAPTDSEVISVTDDEGDDEKTNEGEDSSSTNVTTTEPSAPLSVEDSEVISLTDNDDDEEKTNEDIGSSSTTLTPTEPSCSLSVPAYTRIEPQYSNGFQSQHKHERVKQILQCTEEEFKSMKNDSKLISEWYLQAIKKTMNLEDKEILNTFSTQEEESLDDECRAMIEFIKYVKNDFPDQDLFNEISSDLLEALAEFRK